MSFINDQIAVDCSCIDTDGKNNCTNVIKSNWRRQKAAEGAAFLPVLEEAPKAEGHQLQRGLDHKGGGEDVVAVLERRLQRLRQK